MSRSGRVNEVLGRLAGGVALVALAFSQKPGLIVADTKLDLVLSPGSFLARSLQVWDPQAGFGQLQNQAYGYLFPMGPFFWLGHALGIPAWVTQRLWWSLLLLVAYVGFLKLCDALGTGSSWGRVVGGLAYALGPRLLTVLGPISAEALPLALLPWVLLPLVIGSQRGSPRRAAAASGVAILCIGGINAAASLAVLLVPAIWLLTRRAGPRKRSLLGWWSLSVVLATSWWVLPLLLLGRYAFPFLDAIESSRTTTSVTSATNVLRGADHWVGYLVTDGRPTWQAGWMLATNPVLVTLTCLVAVFGLWGLGRPSTPERSFLVLCLVVGVTLVGMGHSGPAGAPLAEQVQSLLDGALAALRNVHKFDPVLRLPLTLGLTVALSALPAAMRRLAAATPGEEGVWLRARPAVAPAVGLLCVLGLLVGAATPAWTSRIPNEGAFARVPSWWDEASSWLGQQSGRTLLEPASGFGEYTWGRPWDEPLQALAEQPWAVRGAVPLGSPGLTRVLDSVEGLVTAGRPSTELAPGLRRIGVRYVLLRNDLATMASATPAGVARATLVHSPGLRLVRGFGPPVSPALGGAATGARVASLEVFEVEGDGLPDAALYTAGPLAFTGGPEAVLRDADGSSPWVSVEDGAGAARTVVTDTLVRRQLNVGADVTRDVSDPQGAATATLGGRTIRDLWPYDGAYAPSASVVLPEGATLEVSSTATDPFLPDYRGPVGGAAAVLDDSPTTVWVAAEGDENPSWSLDLGAVKAAGTMSVGFGGLPRDVARATALTVETDRGETTVPVDGDQVTVPVGDTRRVTLILARAVDEPRPVGLSSVTIGSLDLTPSIAVAEAARASTPQWSFAADPISRPACVRPVDTWTCQASLARAGGDQAALDRTFVSAEPVATTFSGSALPRPGPELDELLDQSLGFRATASSRSYPDAAARPGAAYDGDPTTAWIPTPDDDEPTLRLELPAAVTIHGLSVRATSATTASVLSVAVRGDDGQVREARLVSGTATFAPLTTASVSVTFRVAATGGPARVAVAEVSLTGASRPQPHPVVLPCGEGPSVVLDGEPVPTAVTAAVADLVSGAQVPLQVCAPSERISSGSHRVATRADGPFAVTQLSLVPTLEPPVVADVGAAEVLSWSAEARTVRVPQADQPRILAMNEGFNAGWAARAGGLDLAPVRVDGWRQAWVLPASVSGLVVLDYGPGRIHRTALLVGALLVGVLVLLACWRGRPRQHGGPAGGAALSPTGLALASLGMAGLVAGLWGVGAWAAAWVLVPPGRRLWWLVGCTWAVLAGATVPGSGLIGSGTWSSVTLQVTVLVLAVSVVRGAGTVDLGDHAPLHDDPRQPSGEEAPGEGEREDHREAATEQREVEQTEDSRHDDQVPEEDAVGRAADELRPGMPEHPGHTA